MSDPGLRSRRPPREATPFAIPRVLIVLWVVVFLSTAGNSRFGALIAGDTLPFLIVLLGALIVSALAPVVGVVLGVVRRSWGPLLWSLVSLVAAPLIAYITLTIFLNLPLIDVIRGEPAIVAYSEGTMSSEETLTLRKNGKFDLFGHSWPGVSYYYGGTYQRSGDEILLSFGRRRHGHIPERLFVRRGAIVFHSEHGDRFFIVTGPDRRMTHEEYWRTLAGFMKRDDGSAADSSRMR